MRPLIVVALMFLIGGCATQAERAAQVQRDVEDMITVYGPGCEKLGYKADSDAWRDCIIKLATKDDIDRYSRDSITCVGHPHFFQCSRF